LKQETTLADDRTTDITIQGKQFSIIQPYTAGHPLTDGEAGALNQTFAENIRNNTAKWVQEALDGNSFDQDELQSKIADYAESYEFGARVGGRSSDPVMAAALDIAKTSVRKALKRDGHKLSDYKTADISEKARKVLEDERYREAILTKAKERVQRESELVDVAV
jgi:rubrerythrin